MSPRGDPPLAALRRTLNGVMDRMEKFFSDLRDFLQKMEATQQSTSRELAMGAQTQEKQLKGTSAVPLCQNGRGVPAGAGDTQETGRRCSESARGWEPRLAEPCLPWSLGISGSFLCQTVSWGMCQRC